MRFIKSGKHGRVDLSVHPSERKAATKRVRAEQWDLWNTRSLTLTSYGKIMAAGTDSEYVPIVPFASLVGRSLRGFLSPVQQLPLSPGCKVQIALVHISAFLPGA